MEAIDNKIKLLFQKGGISLEEIEVYSFENDLDYHNNELIERIYLEYSNKFLNIKTYLSNQYGEPIENGNIDNDKIPLCGVLHYSIWKLENCNLFIAVAHEDRELPILLMIGKTESTKVESAKYRKEGFIKRIFGKK